MPRRPRDYSAFTGRKAAIREPIAKPQAALGSPNSVMPVGAAIGQIDRGATGVLSAARKLPQNQKEPRGRRMGFGGWRKRSKGRRPDKEGDDNFIGPARGAFRRFGQKANEWRKKMNDQYDKRADG